MSLACCTLSLRGGKAGHHTRTLYRLKALVEGCLVLVSHRWVAHNWVRRREAEEADGSGPHGIRRNVESQLLMQSYQFPKRVRGCICLYTGLRRNGFLYN